MRKLILLLIATALSLALAEIISNFIRPTDFMKPFAYGDKQASMLHRPADIPGLDYEVTPGKFLQRSPPHAPWTSITIKTNSFGMRGNEPVKPDAGNVCTIAILGDSFTFGSSIEQDDIYPGVLENLYREKNDDQSVQVLNFSVRGYSTRDEAQVLKHKALLWEPNLIVVGYYLNDPEYKYPWNLANYFRKPEWWQYSNILRLVAQATRNREIRVAGGGNYFRYLHAEDSDRWGSVVTAFENIGQLAGDRNIPVLVIIFPDIPRGDAASAWNQYPYEDIHAQVIREAGRNGLSVLDLRDAYRVYPPGDLIVAPGDQHPSRLGHMIAATTVFRTIEDERLLACP